jgi:hypothetical protein
MADVLTIAFVNIKFRGTLTSNKWVAWLDLVDNLRRVYVAEKSDIFWVKINSIGFIPVKSIYANLVNEHTTFLRKYIWKLNIPIKTKILLFFLYREIILTKDNLAKNGYKKYGFYVLEESINHIFYFTCHFAYLVGRVVHFNINIHVRVTVTNLFGNLVH